MAGPSSKKSGSSSVTRRESAVTPASSSRSDQSVTGVQNESQRQRFESLGALAGGIAHDLNNILTGILGHLSYLRISKPELLRQDDSLRAIEDGARRGAALTQQILEYVRGELNPFAPVSILQVVRDAVALMQSTLSENIALRIYEDPIEHRSSSGVSHREISELCVLGDERQLTQVVLNFLVNARDALPEGGMIEVGFDCVQVQGDEFLRDGEYLSVAFRDNGIGIPEELRGRIFEPFFTTKSGTSPFGAGTGIGLSTVLAIVQAHGGTIELTSREGEGSCFRVFLPTCETPTKREHNEEPAEVPGGRERILVVDDEEAVRTVVQRCLEHLGYEVSVAGSGSEALSRYGTDGGFNLVILDMMMPQMAGDEVFSRLREIDSRVNVLIASGYSSDSRARRVLDAGGKGFIQKPFAVEELAREVRRCLDGE